MLMGDDDIPVNLTEQDKWGGWIMKQLDDGWCSALNSNTMLCTIYERRPVICRDYQVGDSDCIKERLLHTQNGA
jgi:Fe-S-cluster containining protein